MPKSNLPLRALVFASFAVLAARAPAQSPLTSCDASGIARANLVADGSRR